MKKLTFFIEEYDQQCSITKYYKTHSYGINWKHAFEKIIIPNIKDYDYKLLTLNQFNAREKISLITFLRGVLMALWPFKVQSKKR